MNVARSDSPARAALVPAVCKAPSEMSVPNPCAAGNSDSSASRIAPEPVPRSAMRNGRSRFPPARNSSSASSTTVSVSGRGTSVADESCSGSPQNSFSPMMRATGSAARRRPANSSRRADSSGVSWRCAADIRPVRSRLSAWPVRIRASSSADSMAAVLSLAASARRAASTVWPAKSARLVLTPRRLALQAARPDARSSTRRSIHPALRPKSPAAIYRASG